MENNTFKGSLFGGFKREDVIDYITKSSAESASRIEALEADIDKLCTQERELRAQVTSLHSENDALKADLERVTSERDESRKALDASSDELSALRTEVAALRQATVALRAENDELRPLSDQYSIIKEHIAGIELDAHQRAEEYERSVHARLSALIGACRSHCDEVLSTLSETCQNVTGELRRAESSISTLPDAFTALRGGLEKLEEEK